MSIADAKALMETLYLVPPGFVAHLPLEQYVEMRSLWNKQAIEHRPGEPVRIGNVEVQPPVELPATT